MADDLDLPDYPEDTTIRTEPLVIEAPAKIVWEVLLDLPNYGRWNPFCVAAQSTLEMGAPMIMSLANYTMPGELSPNIEYICAKIPDRLISWELKDTPAWPYPARRDQIIEADGPERCRYWSTDAFFGPNGIHVMRFCGSWVKRAFEDSARGLKQRAEAIHRERKAA